MKRHLRAVSLLCIITIALYSSAQKVIIEGDGTTSTSIKAKMELYSRQTTNKAKKALYASFAEPKELRSYSLKLFKAIYDEQLKEMFTVVNGEIIQVKKWEINARYSGDTPSIRLEPILSAREKVPYLHRVQIKQVLKNNTYIAYLDSERIGVLVTFPNVEKSYTKGTVLEAYLLQKPMINELAESLIDDESEDQSKDTSIHTYSSYYECISDEIGNSVRPPTTREILQAIRQGIRPIVKIVAQEINCPNCQLNTKSSRRQKRKDTTSYRSSYSGCSTCDGRGKIEQQEFVKLAR